ncbi:GNAT family N-acetyltransferase [Micromonospora sp. NPDC003197]
MDIRRVTGEERLTTSLPLQAYAFEQSPSGPDRAEEFRRYLPYVDGNVTLVAADGDRAVATASAIPMRQNLRGSVQPMAGVAGVATHPLSRRQGHVRALLHRLLGEMRDAGHSISALYPFRASFYERFGYVGLPAARTVTFAPANLGSLLRVQLPGEVTLHRIKEGYDSYRDLTHRLLADRHGFAVAPEFRAVRQRDDDKDWLAVAEVDGAVVGAVHYRIDDFGGKMSAGDLLTTGPLGRALLLRFFAHHVDQVAEISVRVAADETPELWATDFAVHVQSRVVYPTGGAPMARVLSLEALAGLAVGSGRLTVEVVDDRFIGGSYLLDGTDGKLEVVRGSESLLPSATLTGAGLSGLVYGVLDPADVAIRGFGTLDRDAEAELRTLFPRCTPYLFAEF